MLSIFKFFKKNKGKSLTKGEMKLLKIPKVATKLLKFHSIMNDLNKDLKKQAKRQGIDHDTYLK